MTDTNSTEQGWKINKVKIYSAAIGIFLVANLLLQVGITLLENELHQWLYPIFPYTCAGLLIITIMVTNAYIRRREHRPKQKLWWRILRPILLILVIYGLTMAAWFSVSEADTDRNRAELEKAIQDFHSLPEPPPPTILQ